MLGGASVVGLWTLVALLGAVVAVVGGLGETAVGDLGEARLGVADQASAYVIAAKAARSASAEYFIHQNKH